MVCNSKIINMTSTQNIVALATESAKTLAAAVTAADLVKTLEGTDPSPFLPQPMPHLQLFKRMWTVF